MSITISTTVSPFVAYTVDSTMALARLASLASIQRVDPISDETLKLLFKIFNATLIAICLTGLFTNAVTMRTFYCIGLKDSMTISFFFLAVCDFSTCTFVCISIVCDTLNILVNEGLLVVELAPYVPYFYVSASRMAFSLPTAILKVYMAIQRCLCVALPFHVRGLFTRIRTFVFVGVMFTLSLLWTVLFLSGHTFIKVNIPMYNITYLVIHRIAALDDFVNYQEFMGGVVFSIGFQVVSWTCFMILIVALRKSARFRKSVTKVIQDGSKNVKNVDGVDEVKEKTNSKENQVLVQVALLTGIFCLTGGLHMVHALCTLLIPGYAFNSEYHNLYLTLYTCALVAEMLNSAGNFLIYVKFNSKFRFLFFHASKTDTASSVIQQ